MPSQTIQWFPGHMAKTRRMISENLKLVDVVIELADARVPRSSRNPEIPKLCASKPRLLLMTKSSLADPSTNDKWLNALKRSGEKVIFLDSATSFGINKIYPAVCELLSDKIRRYEEKGMTGKKLRAMIVGIPNVGKSSLINRLTGAKKAKVEDRPGVTRDKQWVSTSIGLELLDTPGVLWPKFDDPVTGENLAATGAIKDDILDTETLAATLCERLMQIAPEKFCARYKLDAHSLDGSSKWELMDAVARKRGFLISGGEIDYDRASAIILDEFRSSKIGRITLELPDERETRDVATAASAARARCESSVETLIDTNSTSREGTLVEIIGDSRTGECASESTEAGNAHT